MTPPTLIPDWQRPKSIGLVWPEDLKNFHTRCLVNCFYMDLIRLLIDEIHKDITLTIIHRKGEKERLQGYYGKDRLNLIQNNEIQDIWIRDFAPFWKSTAKGPVALKGLYEPWYSSKKYMLNSIHDDEMGWKLGGVSLEPIEIDGEELMLEGGNLTHSGAGLAIMTNRVIADNEHLFQEELIDKLKQSLGLKEIIFVPVEAGDDTGHVDGLVRFISEKEVIVSEYPYPWKKAKKRINERDYQLAKEGLNKIAARMLSYGLNVTRMPNGIPKKSKFGSAEGNYTNFLRVEDKFFIPQYGVDEHDSNAIKALIKAGVDEKDIIKVPDCNDLAALGGVLNCISTHIH